MWLRARVSVGRGRRWERLKAHVICDVCVAGLGSFLAFCNFETRKGTWLTVVPVFVNLSLYLRSTVDVLKSDTIQIAVPYLNARVRFRFVNAVDFVVIAIVTGSAAFGCEIRLTHCRHTAVCVRVERVVISR